MSSNTALYDKYKKRLNLLYRSRNEIINDTWRYYSPCGRRELKRIDKRLDEIELKLMEFEDKKRIDKNGWDNLLTTLELIEKESLKN